MSLLGNYTEGALVFTGMTSAAYQPSMARTEGMLGFDASRSCNIYQDNAHVRPMSISVKYAIKH